MRKSSVLQKKHFTSTFYQRKLQDMYALTLTLVSKAMAVLFSILKYFKKNYKSTNLVQNKRNNNDNKGSLERRKEIQRISCQSDDD